MIDTAESIELRYRVLEEARSWKGTPFRHKQRVKGKAVDCSNLVIGVGECAGVWQINRRRLENVWMPFYGRRPDPERMRRALVDLGLVSLGTGAEGEREAGIGDVSWQDWGDDYPIHMAIIGTFDGRLTAIEAIYEHVVVEETFNDLRRKRTVEYWRYPAIAAAGLS